jgi:hypothetical protein
MHLAMFDIDGTLTLSNDLDDAAFLSALDEVFNIREVSTDWATYLQVTDAGIFREICITHLKRIASLSEEAAFRACFMQQLYSSIKPSLSLEKHWMDWDIAHKQ